MRFTDDQTLAMTMAEAWWNRPDRFYHPCRIDGYAGTGKTFVVEHLVEKLGIDPKTVLALAPTGKAARVLSRRTDWPTSTIHRALYVPLEDPAVTKAREKLDEAKEPETIETARAELAEAEANAKTGWSKNGGRLDQYRVIVVDEAMMVGERVAADLKALEKPMLLLGDPGQLPPVKDKPGFADVEPKAILKEVMRQDEGSAILEAAMAVRHRRPIPDSAYGTSAFAIVPPKTLDDGDYAGYDVVLCGTHKVRRGFNRRLRRYYGYSDDPLPKRGERLIVKRNDYRHGLVNGQVIDVTEDAEPIDYTTAAVSVTDDTGFEHELRINVLKLREHFERRVKVHSVRGAIDVDFAYALTVHAAQGSEWPSVCVLDDWGPKDHNRWLYTALTRGSDHVTLVTGD